MYVNDLFIELAVMNFETTFVLLYLTVLYIIIKEINVTCAPT